MASKALLCAVVFALCVVANAQRSIPAGYWGCYAGQLSGIATFTSSAMDVFMCQAVCAGNNAQFASLFNGHTCTCLEDEPSGSGGGNCDFNAAYQAGGADASSVYITGYNPVAQTPVGCYSSPLTGASITLENNTGLTCSDYCGSRGFAFSGTTKGNVCSCGNSRPIRGSLPMSQCNLPCSGLFAQTCGGASATQVSYTAYMGCYAGFGNPVDEKWPGWPAHDVFWVDVPSCSAKCALEAYDLAGTENGDLCYCGYFNDDGSTPGTSVSSSECNMNCNGNSEELCGGATASNVFLASWNNGYFYSTAPSDFQSA